MIKVLIVDDHQIVREGIRLLLGGISDLNVVAVADNGRSALELVESLHPDVVLMDMSMPGMGGIEATRRIVEEFPKVRVLIISMHKDKRFVSQAIRSGAKGYLLKDCASSELVKAVRAVGAGETYICAEIIEVVIDDYIRHIPESFASSEVELSAREREILQLIAEGNNAKNIAFLLKVNLKTVDTYRHQVMRKLKLYSIAELTKYAVREGMTSLEA